jgi:hypothetical protein
MSRSVRTFLMTISRPLRVLAACLFVFSLRAEEVSRIRKLPAATFRELAAVEIPPPPARETRNESRRGYGRHDEARVRSEAARPRVTTNATITPPPLVLGFASNSSPIISPADTHGAVSSTHILAATNLGFVVHTRTGAPVATASLSQFWNAGNTQLIFYDPRVVYDAAANRWVAMAIRDAQAVMLAVSKTGDPTGQWTRYEIETPDCDYSRLALTRDTVMVNTIIGENETGEVMSFSKAELYAGVPDPDIDSTLVDADAMPVHAPESTVEYVVWSTDFSFNVNRLQDSPSLRRAFHTGFDWTYPFDDSAPQFGAGRVNIGFGDVQAAVLRDGWLYAVHRIGASQASPDGNALMWWKVDPTGAKPHEVGLIDSPAGIIYAYPSLAANRHGGMVISFCTFSATAFPSAAYVYRDPAGRISTPATIRTGTTALFGTDRWGDYTVVVEDPVNERDFWIGQVYATRNSWESWWSHVKVAPPRSRAVRK